jgi:hypothetical protein
MLKRDQPYFKEKRMEKKVRLQVEMPQANADRLAELARQMGVAERDIINGALWFQDQVIAEVEEGRRIVSRNSKGGNTREYVSPVLRDLAAAGNRRGS